MDLRLRLHISELILQNQHSSPVTTAQIKDLLVMRTLSLQFSSINSLGIHLDEIFFITCFKQLCILYNHWRDLKLSFNIILSTILINLDKCLNFRYIAIVRRRNWHFKLLLIFQIFFSFSN